jgi:nucleoside-diphosphate-sugar epimerase
VLRNLLQAGHQVAVLVRPCKKKSPKQRLDHILSYWERELEITLPRPMVIEGDLRNDSWREQYADWFEKSCGSVIHCAASLAFYGASGDEPWRSNVDGTKKILSICKDYGIRRMHYMSTAYVAGSSQLFRENDLDLGQTLRNDYEQSKFDAEKLVRDSDFLEQTTIYRPSIVVGDSKTAYTMTYHGFYAVLKLAHTLVRRMPLGSTSGRNLLAALGMDGSERKNFVPVDWVADVFDHIFSNPQLHGQTYHLTSPSPPLLQDFVDVVQDAVETFSSLATESDPRRADENWFFQNYADQVQIYKAYLQDDPVFDSTNTQTAAPHLPCPVMDHHLMMFLARYAILSRFGKKKVAPPAIKSTALPHEQKFELVRTS